MTDHLETTAIRAGRSADGRALAPVMHASTTFALESVDEGRRLASAPGSTNFYSRYGNPSVAAFEEAIAELEGAEAARAFASGMGAMSAVVLGLCSTGDHIVTQNRLYAGTQMLFSAVCPRFGIEVTAVDGTDPDAWEAAIRPGKTVLCVAETPANPRLDLVDLRRLGAIAGPMTVVDSTFATPLAQRPLSYGVDLVLHSATKALAGHNDASLGVVAGSKELLDWVWGFAVLQGANVALRCGQRPARPAHAGRSGGPPDRDRHPAGHRVVESPQGGRGCVSGAARLRTGRTGGRPDGPGRRSVDHRLERRTRSREGVCRVDQDRSAGAVARWPGNAGDPSGVDDPRQPVSRRAGSGGHPPGHGAHLGGPRASRRRGQRSAERARRARADRGGRLRQGGRAGGGGDHRGGDAGRSLLGAGRAERRRPGLGAGRYRGRRGGAVGQSGAARYRWADVGAALWHDRAAAVGRRRPDRRAGVRPQTQRGGVGAVRAVASTPRRGGGAPPGGRGCSAPGLGRARCRPVRPGSRRGRHPRRATRRRLWDDHDAVEGGAARSATPGRPGQPARRRGAVAGRDAPRDAGRNAEGRRARTAGRHDRVGGRRALEAWWIPHR